MSATFQGWLLPDSSHANKRHTSRHMHNLPGDACFWYRGWFPFWQGNPRYVDKTSCTGWATTKLHQLGRWIFLFNRLYDHIVACQTSPGFVFCYESNGMSSCWKTIVHLQAGGRPPGGGPPPGLWAKIFQPACSCQLGFAGDPTPFHATICASWLLSKFRSEKMKNVFKAFPY